MVFPFWDELFGHGKYVQSKIGTTQCEKKFDSMTSLSQGGYDGTNILGSTEIFKDGQFHSGPDLPIPITKHCVVRFSTNQWLITGGDDGNVSSV